MKFQENPNTGGEWGAFQIVVEYRSVIAGLTPARRSVFRYAVVKSKSPDLHIHKAAALILTRRSQETTPSVEPEMKF